MEGGREDSSHSQLVEVHFVHVRTNSELVKKYVMYTDLKRGVSLSFISKFAQKVGR